MKDNKEWSEKVKSLFLSGTSSYFVKSLRFQEDAATAGTKMGHKNA